MPSFRLSSLTMCWMFGETLMPETLEPRDCDDVIHFDCVMKNGKTGSSADVGSDSTGPGAGKLADETHFRFSVVARVG